MGRVSRRAWRPGSPAGRIRPPGMGAVPPAGPLDGNEVRVRQPGPRSASRPQLGPPNRRACRSPPGRPSGHGLLEGAEQTTEDGAMGPRPISAELVARRAPQAVKALRRVQGTAATDCPSRNRPGRRPNSPALA